MGSNSQMDDEKKETGESTVSLEQQVDILLRQGDIDGFVEVLDDIQPEAWVLDAVLEFVQLPKDVGDVPEPIRRLFQRARVEVVFECVTSFLHTTVYVHSTDVVVVSPAMDVAVALLQSKVDGPVSWSHILQTVDANQVIRFLESTTALPQVHALHYGNVVPIITRRALDLEPVIRGGILDRLCFRGYARLVVETILNMHKAAPTSSFPGVLQHFPDTGQGARRFVTEALYQVPELELPADRVDAMERLIPPAVYASKLQVRLQLDILLTRARLGAQSVLLLVDYLDRISGNHSSNQLEGQNRVKIHEKKNCQSADCVQIGSIPGDALITALERAVGVWGGPSATNRLSAYQQKVLANFIVRSLRSTRLSRADIENRMGLVPKILKGISVYLESPYPDVRKIGMCVGNALSSVLSPDSPQIFTEEGLDSVIRLDRDTEGTIQGDLDRDDHAKIPAKRVVVERREGREPDSDDDTDSEFGYQDNLSELDQDDAEENYRLQEVVKMLGGSDENWKEHLEAISVSEQIIKASPDELGLYVEPLTKGLIFTRLPAWAKDNEGVSNLGLPRDGQDGAGDGHSSASSSSSYERKRMDALLALVIELPEAAGGCLIDAFYSPSSNIEHRTKSLQLLSTGAKELSSEIKGGVILQWSAKLLGQCDKPRHGIDMFGRDTFLLGSFLCTMGNFLEACGGMMESLYLGTAVIKLVLCDTVRRSPEIFVLRSALAAAARAISSVPAASICASVAESMLPSNSSGRLSQAMVKGGTPTTREFCCLLTTAKSWFEEILSSSDGDDTCQKLAQGCLNYLQLLVIDALEERARQLRLDDVGTGINVDVPLDLLTQKPEIQIPGSGAKGVIYQTMGPSPSTSLN